MTQPPSLGRTRQIEILISGVGGRLPAVPVEPRRLAAEAERALSAEAWTYVAGSAGTEETADANRAAFERWQIVPRMLRDVSQRDLSVELFGERLPAPLLLAPIAVLGMAHRQADLAVARAAAAEGVPMIFSNQASVPMEDCARVMGEAPRWFQLYWSTSDELVASFVERAERCGCGAIVLTLDTTMMGWRARDLDIAYLPFIHGQGLAQYTSDPVFRKSLDEPVEALTGVRPPRTPASVLALLEQIYRYPGTWAEKLSGKPLAAVQRFLATYMRPSLSWDHLAWLRERTKLPILLKGILHPEDAKMAIGHGMDGIVVSNHGGRQLDGEIGALDALPGVLAAVEGKVPVLFDSGIRGGADVFKALALGATAVCLGRPYVYALAVGGERGVREVIKNVVAELDVTLGLAGLTSLAEIGPEALVERRTGSTSPRGE